MKGYLHGGPDLNFGPADRWVDAIGQELHVPAIDTLGYSPLIHVWMPTLKVVTDLANGQYRIWDYFGLVYRDGAVGPRAADKVKADIRLKWYQIEDHMKELGLRLDLHLSVSNSFVEASIDVLDGDGYISLDYKEEDIY